MFLSEKSQLGTAAVVLYFHDCIRIAGLGYTNIACHDNSGKRHLDTLSRHHLAKFFYRAAGTIDHLHVVRIQRMGGQIHAYKVFFLFKAQHIRPLHCGLDLRTCLSRKFQTFIAAEVKERTLAVVVIGLIFLSIAYEDVSHRVATRIGLEEVFALHILCKAVKRAGQCEILECAAVERPGGHTFYKVIYAFERFVSSSLEYALDHPLTHALDGAQAEAYVALGVDTETAV